MNTLDEKLVRNILPEIHTYLVVEFYRFIMVTCSVFLKMKICWNT